MGVNNTSNLAHIRALGNDLGVGISHVAQLAKFGLDFADLDADISQKAQNSHHTDNWRNKFFAHTCNYTALNDAKNPNFVESADGRIQLPVCQPLNAVFAHRGR